MTVPSSISVECPICKEETLHEVLSGKMGGKAQAVMDSTVRCRQCGQVHHVIIKCEKPVEIPVIISWLTESKRSSISLGPDEVLCVEDEVMCGDEPVLVTSIESKGARPKRAKARDIQTIWGKRFEKVRVPFSISHAGKSSPEHVMAVPDEEFFVGDIITFGSKDAVIHTIKTKGRVIRNGGAPAREIVRVYANIVRKSSY
ncbi:MAG TPA: HVO_0476 family zinc finger protein [Thermoplasmata archaeon]|nr:HVO_0476 family zinc finger protein [Thermoplasmata archaeon]